MSLEADARDAARAILEGRKATAPAPMVPSASDRALSPADVQRRIVTKLEWRQAARLHLLAAQNAIEQPEPSVLGKPWSSRFAYSMAQHLLISAKDESLSEQQQVVLLAAAFALQRMLNDNGAEVTKRRIELLAVDKRDWDWVVSLGISQSRFRVAVDSLASFHKLASSQVPVGRSSKSSSPIIGSIRAAPSNTSPIVPSTKMEASTPSIYPPVKERNRPAWLALGQVDGSTEPAVAPSWRIQDAPSALGHDELTRALGSAWDAFAIGNIRDADDTLHPIYASASRAWRPMAGPDGHLLWNWLRFVRLAASAYDMTCGFRRLAAVSAAELMVREDVAVTEKESVLEQLVEIALSDLRPVLEGPLSRAFAAYSGRLLAALGHEDLFHYLRYSNEDRARAREVWVKEFAELGLTERSNSAELAATITKAYREFRYRATEQTENYRLTQRFLTLIDSSSHLFDLPEDQLAKEALALLSETLMSARSPSHIDVPIVRELDGALQNLGQEVCASGSLLLQETLYPVLEGARMVLAETLSVASRVSHPELSAELISAKLPLTAKGDRPFRVRFLVRNTGNSVARELWLQASSDCLTFEESARSALDLVPASEQELYFEARSTVHNPTASLTLRLTWRDDLGQDFEAEEQYLAEDQRQSMWTPTDANPYTLSSISDPARLVGRSVELASLEGVLRMSDSTYVTGLKRVGKSSLVRTLLAKLLNEGGWAISVLELGTMLGGSSTPASIALGVIDGINEALVDAGVNVPQIEMSDTAQSEYARQAGRWLRALEKSTTQLKNVKVVVAIDDFDGIPTDFVDGENGRGLFLFLRSLVDKPWLSLVFIGSEVMPTVIAGQGYQLNQVRRTPLDHFNSKEGTSQLLRAPVGQRLEWSEESVERVHQMSNGNPYYATMIAQRIWDVLRSLDRTLVELSDVTDAVAYVAGNQDPFHFSHMWGDDPVGMAPKSHRAMLSAALLLSAARCAPTSMSSAEMEEILGVAQTIVGEATIEELSSTLQRLLSRQILTIRGSSTNVGIRVPLLAEWLRARGRSELESEFEQFTRTGGTKRAITAGDLVDLAEGLNYTGQSINALQLQAWIDQCGDDKRDQHLMFLLLKRLVKEGYFSNAKIYRSLLPKLRDGIRSAVPELQTGKQNYITNAVIVNHGPIGSSAPVVVANLHQVLRVKKENCVPVQDVPRLVAQMKNPVVIMVDDFAGTGNQLAASVDNLCAQLDQIDSWRESTVLVVGAAIAADTSLWTADRFGGANLRTVVGQVASERVRAFSDSSQIFDSEDDRDRARDLVTVIGKSLLPNNPLGWGSQGLLVLLETNCPNNTLPIFWKEGRFGGRPWRPLFPRVL